MSEQKEEFESRRMDVLRKHMVKDKKYQAMRRSRKSSILRGALGGLFSLALALVLMKTMLVAFHGETGYQHLAAAPITATREMGFAHQALLPDPYTSAVADVLAAYLPDRAEMADIAQTPVMPSDPES